MSSRTVPESINTHWTNMSKSKCKSSQLCSLAAGIIYIGKLIWHQIRPHRCLPVHCVIIRDEAPTRWPILWSSNTPGASNLIFIVLVPPSAGYIEPNIHRMNHSATTSRTRTPRHSIWVTTCIIHFPSMITLEDTLFWPYWENLYRGPKLRSLRTP